MTLDTNISKTIFHGNGVATTFPFAFKVWSADQLTVTVTMPGATEQTEEDVTAQCSISLTESGGSVVYLREGSPLPAGAVLSITRDMPFVQEVDLVSASRFDPQVIEDALDQAAAERQQLREGLSRAVKLSATSATTPEDMVEDIFDARDQAEQSATGAAASATAAADSATAAASSSQKATTAADRATDMANVGPAKADKLGMIKIGEGIAVEEDGTISVTPVNLATSEVAGTVRPGTGMTVDDGGALHIAYWDAFPPYVPIPIWGVTFGGSDGRRAIMPGETAAREDWLLCDGGNDGKGGVVPNLMGRVLLGAESNDQEGTLGGSTSHTHTMSGATSKTTLSIAQIPNHKHSYTSYNSTNDVGYSTSNSGAYKNLTTTSTGGNGENGAHAHDVSTVSVTEASNYMPFCAAIFVMKTI